MSKNIYIGPWVGEFGHWVTMVAPFIHGIRYANPEARIIVGGFNQDDELLKDANGRSIIDEYCGFDWWPCDRGNADIKGQLSEDAIKVLERFKAQSNHINICNIPLKEYSKVVKGAFPKKYLLIGSHIEEKDGEHLVIFPRLKDYPNPRPLERNWTKEKWLKLLPMLANKYPLYIGGVGSETIKDLNHPNIHCLADDENRQKTTIRKLRTAKATISDVCGGSHLTIQTGCPIIVHGPDCYQYLYNENAPNNRNYFHTNYHYYNWGYTSERWSVERRYKEIMLGIDNIEKSSYRHKYSEIVQNA
jgi:hypothetical protein